MAKKETRGTTQERERRQENTQAMQTTERQASPETGMTRREPQSYPTLFGGSPFTFMRRFSEEMDRLFEDFGFGRGWLAPATGRDLFGFGDLGRSLWSPQVEVFEREGQLVVR